MLPEGYTYKMVTVTHFKDLDSFNCELKINLETEESVRKWIADSNEMTETMVYGSYMSAPKNQGGKRVVYLCCQHADVSRFGECRTEVSTRNCNTYILDNTLIRQTTKFNVKSHRTYSVHTLVRPNTK